MIALVACSATKLGHRAPARELYQGDTFKLVRRILEHPASRVDDWAILSAKHGLVLPTDALDPYDLYLGDLPTDERAAWHERVLDQIARAWGTSQVYEIYAGAYYTNLQWYRTLPYMERVYATWAREHSNSPSRTRFGIGHIRRRLAIRLATLDAAAEVSPPLLADEVPTAPVLNPRTHRLGSQMAWLFEPTPRTPKDAQR